jgi:hypothetical protein
MTWGQWGEVTNEERLREFSPRQLRKTLKKRDGKELDTIRHAENQLFSEHAAHLTTRHFASSRSRTVQRL